MPVYTYVIINAVLVLLIGGAVVGIQLWSIVTQHRDLGCENVRLRLPRIRVSVSLARAERISPQSAVDAELIPPEVVLG